MHGAGVCCQCGKVGCQWGVGVKIADHGDTPEQVAEKGAEVEFARCEVFAVLLDAQRGVKSDFDMPGHGGDCRQFGRLLGFKFAVFVNGFGRSLLIDVIDFLQVENLVMAADTGLSGCLQGMD